MLTCAIEVGRGISLRLDDFEKEFFPLAERVKARVPFYAHVHISIHGLQFEFPEHHFLRDLETSLPELLQARTQLASFRGTDYDAKRDRDRVAGLVATENLLSRSIISATFSLVEAFLSGLFFCAVHMKSVGREVCDEQFLRFATTKESAPLKDRVDRVVQFASKGAQGGNNEPFKTLIEVGKRYRDAIHHTTPFQRKDVEPGGRLTALYEINGDVALNCVRLGCGSILQISQWIDSASDVAARSGELIEMARKGCGELAPGAMS